MKVSLLPLPNGWNRMPDQNGDLIPFQVENICAWWWSYVENGQVLAIAGQPDGEPLELNAAEPGYPHYKMAEVWSREAGLTPFDQMRRVYVGPFDCRYNGQQLPFEMKGEGLGPTADFNDIARENAIVAEAVEKLKTQMRRTLRAFPACGCGGIVNVVGKINRSSRTVQAVYRCTCGY